MNKLISDDGRFELNIQGDGNLVTYDRATGKPVWDSMSGKWHGYDPTASWPPPGPEPGPDPEPTPRPPTGRGLVNANFCNLRDSRGRRIFSSCLAAQTPDMIGEWIDREVQAGGTEYVLSVETGYASFDGPADWGYREVVHFYRAGRFREILTCLERILAKNLTPVLFLDPGGPFPGTAALVEIVKAVPAELADLSKFVLAWEPVKGDWPSDALSRAARAVRYALGDHRILLCHLSPGRAAGSSNPREDADPWKGDEVGFWFEHGGEDFDGFLYQSDVPRGPGRDKLNAWGFPCWQERGIEVAERFLPPGSPMPGAAGFQIEERDDDGSLRPARVHPGVAGYHSWFGANGNGRKRGLVPLTWFEATAYTFIREQSDEAWAREVATWAKSVGFQAFGNGLPV